jgi:rubrerythrin
MKKDKTTGSATEVPDLKVADYVVTVELNPNMNYKDALIFAMQKEKASFHLYFDLAREIKNQIHRDIFLSLAQEEARHKLRFEIEYDDVVLKEN